ncbi:MAG: PadR family transcriptional regulator [Lutispora sp.]|nr:PadR family transcriptional regulator [Lutispora sp.]MDD4835182.1 PadR family transcriptional regulator [Lutispora sp.]
MAREQLKTLTEQMYYILLSLISPNHGYGIMQEVDRRTQGRVKIGAGTLYNLLSRFEEEYIIEQISEEDRRKTYVITQKGLDILKEEYQRLIQLVSDGRCFLEGGKQDA